MMKNTRAIAALLLLVCLLTPLLAACSEEKEPLYTGENEFSYTISPDFTINVKDEAKKVLRCTVVLWFRTEKFAETLDAKLDIIRDHVIQVGRSKSLEDLQDQNIMTTMSNEITKSINKAFNTDEICFVTFPQFFYQ